MIRTARRNICRKLVRFWQGILLGCWISSALASPACRVDPERKKVFRLELTVPATFCQGHRQDPSCRDFPKPSAVQLHGLWPNYESGYPAGQCPETECREQPEEQGKYCRYPAPPGLYQSSWWPELKVYMAGTEGCLERHEWVKHGTCSAMNAETYFRWALERTKDIATALAPIHGRTISRGDFDHVVRMRLPDLHGTLRLTCRGQALSSLYVVYEWGNPPARPITAGKPGNHFGNCPNSLFIPTRPLPRP